MRTLGVATLGAMAFTLAAQQSHQPGMHMGGPALFLGRATGDQVVPRQSSAATATAAIIIDRDRRQLRYDLTYTGLERGAATRIALYNFGAGANGATVVILCGGEGAPDCPARNAARLAGTAERLRWSGPLLSEFASGRVYLQIDAGDGRPEIRGQLAANGAMVPSRTYLARLMPSGEPGAAGEGTAVLSETFLPRGRIAVQYHVTVAGTSGTPEALALVGAASPGDPAARFVNSARLPNARRVRGARAGGGATFNGGYTASATGRNQILANAMIAGARRPVLTVRTSRFPRGELIGEFVPVE